MERDYVSGANKKKTDKFKSRETFNVYKTINKKRPTGASSILVN